MKWIRTSPSGYKLVDDDDPREAVEIPAKKGSPSVKFTPSWKKYEKYIHNPEVDAKTNKWASEMFTAERERSLKTDSQAKRWEESRKKEFLRHKSDWLKKVNQ